MPRLLLLIFAISFALSSCETNPGVAAAFKKYRHEPNATAISIPGWLVRTAAGFIDLDSHEKALLRSVDRVKVLELDDPSVDFSEEFLARIKSHRDYEPWFTVRSRDENIHILGRSKGNEIRELIILVSGDENVLVYLKGHFDTAALQAYADKGPLDPYLVD